MMLYAVCGLTLTLLIRLPALLPLGPSLPPEAELRIWAITATQHYSHGGFFDIVAFRWHETRSLIAPLCRATLIQPVVAAAIPLRPVRMDLALGNIRPSPADAARSPIGAYAAVTLMYTGALAAPPTVITTGCTPSGAFDGIVKLI